MNTRTCTTFAPVALTGMLLATAPADAQQAGSTLWTFNQVDDSDFVRIPPDVAADGMVYFAADELYAINPDGSMQWSVPLTTSIPEVVDHDADHVYTGVGDSVLAFDRTDGSPAWSFTDTTGGAIQAGPGVGPDGNVYAIYDLGDMGAVSFTPQGAMRWNLAGFSHNGGSGWGQIAFASDRFYYDDQNTPAPGTLSALVAIDFDGNLIWHNGSGSTAGPRPRAAPNDNVLQQSSLVSARDNAGTLLWSNQADDTMVKGPGIGPDSSVYVNENDRVIAYGANGATRWDRSGVLPALVAVVARPTVSPDNEVVVYGTSSGNGGSPRGVIVAVDVGDGSLRWSRQLETGDLDVRAAPAFSPDGEIVYVPIENSAGNGRLVAIQAQDPPADERGDLDGNGAVDVFDLFAMLNAFGPCADAPCAADLDGSGVIDVFDLFILLNNWS